MIKVIGYDDNDVPNTLLVGLDGLTLVRMLSEPLVIGFEETAKVEGAPPVELKLMLFTAATDAQLMEYIKAAVPDPSKVTVYSPEADEPVT